MSSTKKRILIVEDDRSLCAKWQAALGEVADCTLAHSIEAARAAFAKNSFDLIVLDACVPGDDPNTLPLAREFRETFSGPMVAASGFSGYCHELVKAGCDHTVGSHGKSVVPRVVLGILERAAALR